MTVYPDAMTLGEARTHFFARWSLGEDGGYGDRWVRVETKPIPVYFLVARKLLCYCWLRGMRSLN